MIAGKQPGLQTMDGRRIIAGVWLVAGLLANLLWVGALMWVIYQIAHHWFV